jgi:tetratricopeptide (TPR) repeat protein
MTCEDRLRRCRRRANVSCVLGVLLFTVGGAGVWILPAKAKVLSVQEEVIEVGPYELTLAIEAMNRREYPAAITHFESAHGHGADPDVTLGRAAECYYYLGDDRGALDVCYQLHRETRGASKWAPFVCGLVLKRQGKAKEAADFFDTALFLGHPAAKYHVGGQ